jgi:hypothetical protein
MTIFNLILHNNLLNQDIVFYSLFTGCVGVIGWSLYSTVLNRSIFNSVQTFFEGTTTSSVTDSTFVPRTFSFTQAQLSEIQSTFDQVIETEPTLSVRNIDLSEINPTFVSGTSDSIQTVSESTNIGVETLLSSSNQGLQTMLSPDLSEIVTRDNQASTIIKELTDDSMQTLVQMVEKGVQTNPDMNIDLSSTMYEEIERFTSIWPSNVDLSEGYMPVSVSVIEIVSTVTNNIPWL